MGDRVRVQFPVRNIYLGMWPATQVNSGPFIGRRSWVPAKGWWHFAAGSKGRCALPCETQL